MSAFELTNLYEGENTVIIMLICAFFSHISENEIETNFD